MQAQKKVLKIVYMMPISLLFSQGVYLEDSIDFARYYLEKVLK